MGVLFATLRTRNGLMKTLQRFLRSDFYTTTKSIYLVLKAVFCTYIWLDSSFQNRACRTFLGISLLK